MIKAYNKSVKVVESCETLDHLQGASSYINNFFLSYSITNNRSFLVNQQVADYYELLKEKLKNREKTIKGEW